MKILKKALRILLCASLVCSIGISAAACGVNDDDRHDGTIELPDGTNPNPDETPDTGDENGKPDETPETPDETPDGGDEKVTYYVVNFNAKGGSQVESQTVESGKTALKPANPSLAGHLFQGWFTDDECKNAYSFESAVNANLTLYAKWAKLDAKIKSITQYNESFQITWTEGDAAQATVLYKATGDKDWTRADENLITVPRSGEARADIIGLNADKSYDVKIITAGTEIIQNEIVVEAYDRSGYAHFNYSDGVGAYNDDGTLKDGALVIYVTETNKNDVTSSVYKNTANGLVKENISQYIKPGKPMLNGKDLGGETYGGIGYLLNNRGYENGTERESYGIQKLTFTYGAVAVRIVGSVVSEYNGDAPTVHGLTYYAKNGNLNPFTGVEYVKGAPVPNGGTVGDNGQMARITNAKNLTIEGIGEGAGFNGWGVHFVSNDNLEKYGGEAGKGFEVRNLTFENYPEDAIGMEGTQGIKVDASGSITQEGNASTARIISGVERCWIHNNTFLPGHCANPAESDKAEGDGSCDFKRGQYYTLSYNYFEYCHKTNLIGSSDDSLQYNISMHHNWWYNCGSRIPLLRNGNVHFYNNYVYGDANDKNAAMSYVHSMRANSYLFSEANYYDGCKQVTRKETETGRAKGFNNVFYSCFELNEITAVDSRAQGIANTCKYTSQNIDYSAFDTDPSLFYYDATNETSKCLLDSPVEARIKVIENAGANGFVGRVEVAFNKYTPSAAVQVGEQGLTIDLSKVGKNETTVCNVHFAANSGYSNGLKIRGQGITFTLTAETEVIIGAAGNADADCLAQLFRDNGAPVVNEKFSELTAVLPAGTYIIASGKKDKDTYISKLSFADTYSSSAARVEALKTAINALPMAIVTEADAKLVEAAESALEALTATERQKFIEENAALLEKLESAKVMRDGYFVAEVIALIDAIGTVTAESYEKIAAAEEAFVALPARLQDKVTNYPTLTAAIAAYAELAVTALRDDIDALTDVTGWNAENKTPEEVTEALDAYNALITIYEDLSEEQQELVTNADKLVSGITVLNTIIEQFEENAENAKKLENFRKELTLINIDNINDYSYEDLLPVVNAYKTLGELVNELTSEETAKYEVIKTQYDQAAPAVIGVTFLGGKPSGVFTSVGSKQNANNKALTVHAYSETQTLASGLKLESGTELSFTLEEKTVLRLYLLNASKAVKINKEGNSFNSPDSATDANGDNVIEVTLDAGVYTLSKADSAALYYATLTTVK